LSLKVFGRKGQVSDGAFTGMSPKYLGYSIAERGPVTHWLPVVGRWCKKTATMAIHNSCRSHRNL